MIKISSSRFRLPPASKVLMKVVIIVTGLACVLHIMLGASPIVVFLAGITLSLSLSSIAIYGLLNVPVILIAVLGFRYVGFPLFAKLAMGQPLDTNLLDPVGSYLVVFVGILGYLFAKSLTVNLSVGRPVLHPVPNKAILGRISFLAAIIGLTANLSVAFRTGEQYGGLTVAEFFVSFLHLSLIAAIARVTHESKMNRSLDKWVVILLFLEIFFAMVQNSRIALMEVFLCYIVTVFAFEARIKWRPIAATVLAIGIMVIFITPVFLQVRHLRDDLSWIQRINATFYAAVNWNKSFANYLEFERNQHETGHLLNYYGSPQNALERMTLVNHVDVLKAGTDGRGKVGFEDLRFSLERAMPRFFFPDKPRTYSQGAWLYAEIGVTYVVSGFATAPLIGAGYAAFGWIGAFLYPAVLSLAWFLIVKKISGFNLQGNVWAIYLLLRIHNQFVEGSSDAYVAFLLRYLPQELVLLWVVGVIGRGRFLFPRHRKAYQNYGK